MRKIIAATTLAASLTLMPAVTSTVHAQDDAATSDSDDDDGDMGLWGLAGLLGLIGLAIGFDSLWILAMLVPFFVVIRYGVVAREEAYLERKFSAVYLGYKSRVRRWL